MLVEWSRICLWIVTIGPIEESLYAHIKKQFINRINKSMDLSPPVHGTRLQFAFLPAMGQLVDLDQSTYTSVE